MTVALDKRRDLSDVGGYALNERAGVYKLTVLAGLTVLFVLQILRMRFSLPAAPALTESCRANAASALSGSN